MRGGLFFSFVDDEAYHWWGGNAEFDHDELSIEIVKENELKINEKLTFKTSDYEDNRIYFTSYNDNKDFLTAVIEIPTGRVDIEIDQDMTKGSYERSFSYDERYDSEIENRYILDDLPKDLGGVSYWEIEWNADEDNPQEITIELIDIGDLAKIKYGEDYGGVLISAKYAKRIELRPVGHDNLNLSHPEYEEDSTYLDKTAEGDHLVYVPAGEWVAEIFPTGDAVVSSYATGLIPVNSGEITEIQIPPLSVETSVDKSLDKFLNQQGLKIDKVVENGDEVAFDFTLVDKETKSILPSLENTRIREGGGVDVDIIDITPVQTPPSVVLLLDSSGSMKGQMDATLQAAEVFIDGLPDGTLIQLIDFDTEPKLLEGKTKEEAIIALENISVGGATALYDSIIKGIGLLENLERPTLVAFTDGADENYNGSAPGSKASKEDTLNIVEAAGIQVLTIGFGGDGHDAKTLEEIGEAGHGLYFSASNQEALISVFDAINEKINSTYTARYNRPTESAPSDVPVVNMVVDISGSMDSQYDDTCGYRLEKLKNLFHEFVMSLPEGTQMQLMAFNNEVYIKQILTSDKLKVLSVLGELEAGGGTNILDSVDAGYRTLNAVPSSKKVLLYLTDAALGVEEDEQEDFDDILNEIKDEQMKVLWIGLGEELDATDFEHAASVSGGEYIISEDPTVLKTATDKLLGRLDLDKVITNTSIAIQVVKESDNGLLTPYSASELIELSPIPVVGMIDLAESVKYVTGRQLKQYDEISAKFLTGGDASPSAGVKILKRIPLNEKASNEAASIHLSEMLYLSQLKGVEAPRGGMRYVALFTEFAHILPEQEVVLYQMGQGTFVLGWKFKSTRCC